MNLVKTSFDKLPTGRQCLFRTEKQIVIHGTRIDPGTILNQATKQRAITGQYHEVWEILPERDG